MLGLVLLFSCNPRIFSLASPSLGPTSHVLRICLLFFSFSFSCQFCFQSVCLFVCYDFSVRFLYLSTVPIFNCNIYIISLSQSLFLEFVCFCLNKWTNKWDWRTFIKWSYTFLLLSSWSWSEKFVHLLSIQQQLASGGIAGNSKNFSSQPYPPTHPLLPLKIFPTPLSLYVY